MRTLEALSLGLAMAGVIIALTSLFVHNDARRVARQRFATTARHVKKRILNQLTQQTHPGS